MHSLYFPIILFALWSEFSILYITQYVKHNRLNKKSFWTNKYLFELIPPTFPTLGILCTALGITMGLWKFDSGNISKSLPQLLHGLKFAFISTIAGILGLLIFQKWIAVIQKKVEEAPDRIGKQIDKLTVLSEIVSALQNLQAENKLNTERIIEALNKKSEKPISNGPTITDSLQSEEPIQQDIKE